jgi:hypothetical protein
MISWVDRPVAPSEVAMRCWKLTLALALTALAGLQGPAAAVPPGRSRPAVRAAAPRDPAAGTRANTRPQSLRSMARAPGASSGARSEAGPDLAREAEPATSSRPEGEHDSPLLQAVKRARPDTERSSPSRAAARPSDARSYSDSESEAEPQARQYSRANKIRNYTKKGGGQRDRPKVDNYVLEKDVDTAVDRLEADARAIHDVLPPRSTDKNGKDVADRTYGATTITTAIFETKTKDGKTIYKKFVFGNTGLLAPKLREKAESLGYHVIQAPQAHAEGEMIQYLEGRQGKYEHYSMATDKEHCAECELAMKHYFGAASYNTQTGHSGKVFQRWRNPRGLQEALGPDFENPHRDSDGKRIKQPQKRQAPPSLPGRQQPGGNASGSSASAEQS